MPSFPVSLSSGIKNGDLMRPTVSAVRARTGERWVENVQEDDDDV